jgi:preprotein translocase subunit SecE
MSIMDVKLSETSSGGEPSDSSVSTRRVSLFVFIREIKEELKKVSWTSKEELIFSTKMVILSTFVFGFSIYLVDLSVKGLLEMIKTSVHVIFG